MKPGFSIVIASYNKKKFIEETLQSVFQQTFKDFEILVTDDASTDGSAEVIQKMADQYGQIKFFRNTERKGGNYCRNNGIKNAEKEFLIILDADDLLENFCLEERMKAIEKNKAHDLWIFSMISFRENKSNVVSKWIPVQDNHIERFLSHRLPWTIVQPAWKTEYIRAAGGFDESFVRLQDVELHTRVLLNGARVYVAAGQPDCCYRVENERLNFDGKTFYGNFASGVVSYFNKFYPQLEVSLRKKLYLTLLYALDGIWSGYSSGKIMQADARHAGRRILSETKVQGYDPVKVKLLEQYFNFKLKFRFNIKGLRYFYSKRIDS